MIIKIIQVEVVVVFPWNGEVCKFVAKFQHYLVYRYEDRWSESKGNEEYKENERKGKEETKRERGKKREEKMEGRILKCIMKSF